jgi:hypothetical protein
MEVVPGIGLGMPHMGGGAGHHPRQVGRGQGVDYDAAAQEEPEAPQAPGTRVAAGSRAHREYLKSDILDLPVCIADG